MELANTLAYYDTATITAVKGFMVQAPGKFSVCGYAGAYPSETPAPL